MRRIRPLLLALLCLVPFVSSGCPRNFSPVGIWIVSVWNDANCEGNPVGEEILLLEEGGTGESEEDSFVWTYEDRILKFHAVSPNPRVYEGAFRGRNRLRGTFDNGQHCWEAERISDNP